MTHSVTDQGAGGVALPQRVDEITADWLTAALGDAFPGVRVTTLRQAAFIDGTAQKVRYELGYASQHRAGPPSLWVKGGFDPKGAHQGDAFANEVRFFQDLAPRLQINTPGCFFGGIDAASNNGVLVLEDLLHRRARFGRPTQPLSPEEALAVLTLQARLHARFWRSDEVRALPWLKPGGAIAGAGMVDQYFGYWDAAMSLPRARWLGPGQRTRERVQSAMHRLMRDMREAPICVIHGDSQVGNVFFEPGGAAGYLDWQHCMLGHWGFDVAGFLITALEVADRRVHERDMLAHYLRELAAGGVPAPSLAEAWQDYARYALWCFMWVMCPVEAHPEDVCSANAERACTAMEDLGTLEALGA
jgi:hypothetical protein